MPGNNGQYWWAIRKRDMARCVIWLYGSPQSRRVACARTQRRVTLEDFHLLGPVMLPSTDSYDDGIG